MNSAWVFDNFNIFLFDVCKNVNKEFAIRLFVAAKDSAMAYTIIVESIVVMLISSDVQMTRCSLTYR